jgi:hypothetical protein
MDMRILLATILIIILGGLFVATIPKNQVIDPNNYSQGYTYGKKTGNSYLAPLKADAPFNAGAAQAVKDSKK